MAEPSAVSDIERRPKALHASQSFTRMPPAAPDTLHRKRASTVQEMSTATARPEKTDSLPPQPGTGDVFENAEGDLEQSVIKEDAPAQIIGTIDDLPIEIRSLTERFLDGLLAKVHPAPLTADQLSEMFQDFYERASHQIATHIASLVSQIGRERTQASASSRTSLKGRSRAGSGAKRGDSPSSVSGGEMLTPTEVTDRRRARRMLELKRLAFEEIVERCVCERLYGRLWKHRSTDDDARDEKLRSRTAALSVVGIGLKELHMDPDPGATHVRDTAGSKEDAISISLAPARKSLQLMNDEEYPLGKLQHLTAAHKAIVDTLSEHFPSTSSADEILPTVIYTLITSPPETLSVVSNLCFIQRFRDATKIDGEAAYCLVNLEAAISFLETVDLPSLRSDELPEGPPKTPSLPQTPVSEDPQPLMQRSPKADASPTTTDISEHTASGTFVKSGTQIGHAANGGTVLPASQQRSLSSMMQAQANKIEAGRDNLFSTADRVYESINGTLENSFKFVFGKFRDQLGSDASPLPKTLDDARRLMNSSLTEAEVEDDDVSNLSGRSSPAAYGDPLRGLGDSKMIDLVSGRRQFRDRSADSTRSGGSAKRVAFAAAGTGKSMMQADPIGGAASFITSINPLNRFAVPSFPRFGRGNAPVQALTPTETARHGNESLASTPISKTDSSQEKATPQRSSDATDLNAMESLATLRKIKPPRKRFLDASTAAELRIGDVEDLLQDYKRLAKAIGEAIAM